MKKMILVFLLGISFISCSPEELGDNCPCIDGNCDAQFVIRYTTKSRFIPGHTGCMAY
jgi:hypothetical protein